MTSSSPDLNLLAEQIQSDDPSRAMPALAGLRDLSEQQATPLLLLGLKHDVFMVRSIACSGLGMKRSEAGWQALEQILTQETDPNVRAEAANSIASYGVARAWPLLQQRFSSDHHWLVRCSILSALAEQPEMEASWLEDLAHMACRDQDGTVRVGGVEILARLVREGRGSSRPSVREELAALQKDPDHRVVAAALNGLQG